MSLDPMLHHVLALGGAALLAAAALHKLRGPRAFAVALSGHRLLPGPLVRPVARLLPLLELGLATLLLAPTSAPWAGLLASLLLVLYGAAVATNLLRGRVELDCGCGGPGGERPISWGLVARNLVLAGLLAALLLPVAFRPLGMLDIVHVLLAVATGTVLYAAIDVALANAARARLAFGGLS